MKNILIIGPGKVGEALKRTFSRFQEVEPEMAGRGDSIKPYPETDAIFITTPDSAIGDIVSELSHFDLSDTDVIHMSGSLLSDILDPLRDKNARVAGMHPIKAVTRKTHDLSDSYFDLEGDPSLCMDLAKLIESWNSRYLIVSGAQKRKMHIAAVLVSNYLVTLMDVALELMDDDTLSEDDVKQALIPLMESSVANLRNNDTKQALTGPVQRGDVEVIRDHMNLLENMPELQNLYSTLALRTLRISDLDAETEQQMRSWLK